ncbi:type VI secretion system ATPase TssH [Cedecea neteri]|uniref:type VI secretion system ATPase TssH n=1 Tax=Cedecea neteri TaxID=158822 RepID=UPI003907FEF6
MNHYLKSVISKLNTDSRSALDAAVSHAASQQHTDVMPEHLLLAIIQQQSTLFEMLGLQTGLPVSQLFSALQHSLSQANKAPVPTPVFSTELVEWLMNGWMQASAQWGNDSLTPEALIASACSDSVKPLFTKQVQHALHCETDKINALLRVSAPAHSPKNNDHGGAQTLLTQYTHNLSELAQNGSLDPVLGRESEIRQMVDILLRRRQNNPILTGEPGVGKTALAEGLALRIADGTVPPELRAMEVLTLDLGLLQAGASVKGEFENRLQALLKEITRAPKPIILFIDEAHMLIGAGGQAGQNDAANLLKPALARGELRVIAATTWAEYKKYFEKDAALTRRFQVVKVAEPDIENATTMLRAMTPAMEQHHGVPVLENAIHAAVTLSNRYIAGRQMPDKCVSLLDTACARVAVSQTHEPKEIEAINVQLRAINSECEALKRENTAPKRLEALTRQTEDLQQKLEVLMQEWKEQNALVQQLLNSKDTAFITQARETLSTRHQQHAMVFECVDATCIADVVADWTGIPLGRMLEKEHQQIDALFDRLAGRVIGQDHALRQIAQQIRISRSGMSDPLKPMGVYMLAGPSGTGKTETSLALAELLFGGEESLVTINMSEYQEAYSVSGLKGSPPGYVGYGQGGILTEAVRRNPYSVVLLDEVEKAHPDVMELFYQIFDKGTIEDAEGQQINFRNTLIIMTSNLASGTLMATYDSGNTAPEVLCDAIRPEFERVFSPALMGRMTLTPYMPLSSDAMYNIIALKLERLCKRYQKATETTTLPGYSKRAINWISERCRVAQSGARDIDQVLNQHLLPLMAESALHSAPGTTFKIDVSKKILTLRTEKVTA